MKRSSLAAKWHDVLLRPDLPRATFLSWAGETRPFTRNLSLHTEFVTSHGICRFTRNLYHLSEILGGFSGVTVYLWTLRIARFLRCGCGGRQSLGRGRQKSIPPQGCGFQKWRTHSDAFLRQSAPSYTLAWQSRRRGDRARSPSGAWGAGSWRLGVGVLCWVFLYSIFKIY